jgi:hypothetical protein
MRLPPAGTAGHDRAWAEGPPGDQDEVMPWARASLCQAFHDERILARLLQRRLNRR